VRAKKNGGEQHATYQWEWNCKVKPMTPKMQTENVKLRSAPNQTWRVNETGEWLK